MIGAATLGLAELCKFTLLVLYALLPLIWAIYRWPERKTMQRLDWLRQGGMLSASLLVSLCIVNCGYMFEDTLMPLEDFRFQTTMFTGYRSVQDIPPEGANRFMGTWLGKVPVPLPANMVQGIDTQRFDFERGVPSYLRDEWADRGWWYYYLYALAIKIPLGTWCLMLLAIGTSIFGGGYSVSWRDEMVMLAPLFVLLVFVSSQTGFAVHSRYVIPVLPFLFVWTSKIARVFRMRSVSRCQLAIGGMALFALVWSVGSSAAVYPHSLSYFNELVGGPKGGPKYLLDSNIDWGQDLLYLKDWLDGHSEVKLDGLAYWGSFPATLAGVPNTPFPDRNPNTEYRRCDRSESQPAPRPGWYAVSVNYLYERSGQYRYFLRLEPTAMAGYSIYIYHITLDEANRVRREMGIAELPGADKGKRGTGDEHGY